MALAEEFVKELQFDTDIAGEGFTERQMEAVRLLKSGTVKYLLYGGAVGGGKSFFLRWYCIRRLLELGGRGIRHVQVMLACEDYPSLKDRQLSRIGREFPKWLGKAHTDHKEYGRCFILNPEYGSGVICFRNLDDPSKYQSAEFAMICVDELTKNPYETFTMLRTRIRWPGLTDEETFFIGGTNPGGVGHGWCKQLWMDKDYPEEFRSPTDYTGKFAYVPSKAKDNPHLDQSYWAMLDTLPSVLRAAFRDGDWNIWYGQAFPEFSKQIHVCGRPPVPPNANLYMTFDWGFGAPFSVGWWWVNNDGQLFRFDEWYGWSGQPNQGLRLPDTDIADGIIEREKAMGIEGRDIIRFAGHDCFQKRPDYQGGGQGPSTADVFAEKGLFLTPADSSRILKIRAFRERLRLREDGKPMLYVYENCAQFIRTVSALPLDPNNIEDVDTNAEDHIYDEACQICMARPVPTPQEAYRGEPNSVQRIWARVRGGEDFTPEGSVFNADRGFTMEDDF